MTPDPITLESEPADRPQERTPGSRALPPRRRTWGQRAMLTFLVVLTTASIVASGVAGWAAWKYESIDRTDVALDQVIDDEPRNYLIVGSDTRAGGDPNDPNAKDDHQPLADTIMVVRVDPGERVASVLSLPRDLWVTISGTGDEGRINAAYAAGHQQLINTLRAELGIPIHHYVEVDFAGFQEVVEAIDGVPVWFDRAMRDRNSGLDILHPGCTTLDGYGALAFARSRHLQYWEQGGFRPDGTGDLGRISRQQVFLRRTIARAKSKGLDNPLTLKRLVDVGTANVTLDDELVATEVLALARRFSDFGPDELLTYTLPTTPRTTSGGAQVLDLDVAEAQPLLAMFRDEPTEEATTTTDGGPSTVDDSTSSTDTSTPSTSGATTAVELVAPGDIEVEVYNSAGAGGLAVDTADRLVALGFEVTEWANGDELGHPDEPTTVVRFAPSADSDVDTEAQARTVAAWVASGATTEVDANLEPGTVALFLGADFTELAEPVEPVGPVTGPVDGDTAPDTTPDSTTTTVTPTEPLPSSEVVGMVPLGDPPPDRECG